MSQYPYQPPNPYDPNLGYAMPGAIHPSPRPASVTGLAITGIILGSLWLLCNVVGIGSNAMMMNNGGRNPFMPQLPPMDPLIAKLSVANAVVGLVFSSVMLGGSIGAYRLRPAGRTTMIVWSWLVLLWIVIITIMQIIWIQPVTQAWMQKAQPNNPMAGIMANFAVPIAIFSALLHAIVPVMILILWNRPNVKAAFKGEYGVPPQQPPPMWPPHGPQPQ